ncbi:MAG: hypothetical protein LBH06_02190 [Rikenellaceae bacterium]|jgi:hypothetical protein|nr:hypothetical protein [Rikenellaceae bacterium]
MNGICMFAVPLFAVQGLGAQDLTMPAFTPALCPHDVPVEMETTAGALYQVRAMVTNYALFGIAIEQGVGVINPATEEKVAEARSKAKC